MAVAEELSLGLSLLSSSSCHRENQQELEAMERQLERALQEQERWVLDQSQEDSVAPRST